MGREIPVGAGRRAYQRSKVPSGPIDLPGRPAGSWVSRAGDRIPPGEIDVRSFGTEPTASSTESMMNRIRQLNIGDTPRPVGRNEPKVYSSHNKLS